MECIWDIAIMGGPYGVFGGRCHWGPLEGSNICTVMIMDSVPILLLEPRGFLSV